jgi:quercetin dioxygenase-like cupin family protein
MLMVAVLTLALAGCGGESGGLGGSAEVGELAATNLIVPDAEPLAWIADEFRVQPGNELEHAHEVAFVYARVGRHGLELQDGRRTLEPGKAAVSPFGSSHRHVATASGASTFWEIRLATPDAETPPGARRIFRSERLEGIPARPRASFLFVRIPPGGETSVHTHPGPELIYQLTGRILYQNALIGTVELGPGGLEGIPPATPVQKRNRFGADAEFLSWFLVDPDEPFAPGADF